MPSHNTAEEFFVPSITMDSISRFDRIALKPVKYREQNLYVAFILFRRNIDKVVAGHITDLYLPSAVAQVFVDQLLSELTCSTDKRLLGPQGGGYIMLNIIVVLQV